MAMATLMITPLERPGGSWLFGILWEQNSLIRIATWTENGTIVRPSHLTHSRHCVKITIGGASNRYACRAGMAPACLSTTQEQGVLRLRHKPTSAFRDPCYLTY
jgi:hypothetical protein